MSSISEYTDALVSNLYTLGFHSTFVNYSPYSVSAYITTYTAGADVDEDDPIVIRVSDHPPNSMDHCIAKYYVGRYMGATHWSACIVTLCAELGITIPTDVRYAYGKSAGIAHHTLTKHEAASVASHLHKLFPHSGILGHIERDVKLLAEARDGLPVLTGKARKKRVQALGQSYAKMIESLNTTLLG